MIKKTLFMTVGTGQKDKGNDLAHGLLHSIENINPNKIIFITTVKSQETVSILKEMFYEKYNSKLDDYELITIDNPDNFNECFNKIREKLKEYKNTSVTFDYTSGTKTMAVTAALIAILYHKDLTSISGTRGEDGVIISNTEESKNQNPYIVYDKINLDKVKQLFNYNKFQTAKQIIHDDITLLDNKEAYTDFLDAYDKWDKFQHSDISKQALNIDIKGIKNQIQLNRKAISIIQKKGDEERKEHELRCYYILADLINNARRRYDEGKYDDAIARLYRTLELIEQIQLKNKYGIITSDVDLEKLEGKVKTEYIAKLEQTREHPNAKIKIGSRKGYELLEQLNDKIGKYYKKHENEYKNILNSRNNSILAHGLTSKTKEDYEIFEKLVMNIALRLDDNIKKYLEETKFPKFNTEG